ncbi:MAG: hypothetical protein HOC71_02870 [Candidatus Latescibacteria bacterium]|jgi:hypothetical protein|nr:hypothetical protein [Candidatus Latescibacterota bacterium]
MKNEINKSDIDGYKVALAVRQLEITGINHECYDIEEESIENILIQYGIFYKWNDDEKAMMKDILMEMAAKEEIREAIRWAQMEHDKIILRIPNRQIPSPQVLEIQQKIWKAEMKKKREIEEPDPSDLAEDILKEQKLGVM